jgi:hypothetical protein
MESIKVPSQSKIKAENMAGGALVEGRKTTPAANFRGRHLSRIDNN